MIQAWLQRRDMLVALFLWGLVLATNVAAYETERYEEIVLLSKISAIQAELLKAEDEARDRNFLQAADILEQLQNDEKAAGLVTSEGEPVQLSLAGTEIWYRLLAGKKDDYLADKAQKYLKVFKDAADGKKFPGYEYLIIGLRDCAREKRDWNEVLKIQKQLLVYNPNRPGELEFYLLLCARNPKVKEDQEKFLKQIYENFPPLAELAIDYQHYIAGDKKAFGKVAEWFLKYFAGDEETIKTAIEYIKAGLIGNDVVALRDYCLALTSATIRTADEKVRLILLDERSKIMGASPLALNKEKDRLPTNLSLEALRSIMEDTKSLWLENLHDAVAKADKEELNALIQDYYWHFSDQIFANEKIDCDSKRYKELAEQVFYLWSEESAQRGNRGLTYSKVSGFLDKLAELKKRMEDPEDDLANIDNYKDLFKVPGVSGQLYWMAEKVYKLAIYKDAKLKKKNCLEFFLLPENSDGFTKGAALFHLGKFIRYGRCRNLWSGPENETLLLALHYFLSVHKYPTCLTYIAYSYIEAGKIYYDLKFKKQANALIMVDVPTIDWNIAKMFRHSLGALCNSHIDLYTNCVKHIQEIQKYLDEDLWEPEKRMAKILLREHGENFWKYCLTNGFNLNDRHLAIQEALEDENDFPCEEELFEALTHVWPEMSDLPESIATNRVLNNNIFQQTQNTNFYRRRKK